MLRGLIDTTVPIDLLRVYPPAVTWLKSSTQADLGITTIAWMEVVSGAVDRIGQQRALRLLKHFQLVHLTPADFDWAMQQQLAFQLSHGVGFWDCLIASVNYRLKIPLYTANLKHFAPMLNALAQKPY